MSVGSRSVKRAWPYLRAGLVAFHLLAVCTMATPRVSHHALSKKARSSKSGRAALDGWAQRLSSLGFEVSSTELEEKLVGAARSWNTVRNGLTAPFEDYARLVGARQPWQLFVGADRFPARFDMEIEIDGRWQRIQRVYPTQSDWYADALEHARGRSTLFASSWPTHQRRRRELAHGLAVRAAAEFPEATRFRLVSWRTATPSPEQAQAGTLFPIEPATRDVFDLESLR